MNNNNNNNSNEKSGCTYQEIVNLFFVHGKCDTVLRGTSRMFNKNQPHLLFLAKVNMNNRSKFHAFGAK